MATREEMMAELQGLRAAQSSAKEPEAWYEDFGEGLGVSGLSTYYGIKDLFTDLDDEDRATLADWKKDAAESGWGTAGRVVGELGQLVIPGGAALKGLRLAGAAAKASKGGRALSQTLSKAAKPIQNIAAGTGNVLAKSAPLAGDIAVSAGHGALQLPGQGETRLGNAGQSAGGAVLGGVAGAGISKALRGVRLKPEAEEAAKLGEYLTPGQAAESGSVGVLENLMGILPVTRGPTQALRSEAKKDWVQGLLKEAAPEGVNITKIGHEGFKQLDDGVNAIYNKAWDEAGNISDKTYSRMFNHITDMTKILSEADSSILKQVDRELLKQLEAGGTKRSSKIIDRVLRDQLSSAGKNPGANKELNELRTMLREGLPAEAQKALKKVDAKWPAYLVIKKATAATLKEKGVPGPDQVIKSIQSVVDDKILARGEFPLQPRAQRGAETVGGADPTELMTKLNRLRGEIGVPGTETVMRGLGHVLTGQTAGQQGLRALGDVPAISKILRNQTSLPRQLGAAYEE